MVRDPKHRGKRISGRPPFGYGFKEGDVVEVSDEQENLGRVLRLRGEGPGARRIARTLNDAWIENARTRRWWTHGTIGDLLRTSSRGA